MSADDEEEETIVSTDLVAAAPTGRCAVCDAPVYGTDTHCAGCAPVAPPAPSARSGLDPRPAIERLEVLTPGSKELVSQLREQLRAPAVATALLGGALAAVLVFAVGVGLGVVFSDQSTLGAVDTGKSVVNAGFAQMLNFLQVGYDGGVGKLGPALFVVFPIGFCALAAYAQARRTRTLAPLARLASGAGVGLVFGVLMLVPALAAGSLAGGEGAASVGAADAVLLGVLWGVIGGLLGTCLALRWKIGPIPVDVPAWGRDAVRTAGVALRPLALAFVLLAVAGTVAWSVEALRKPSVRFGMPAATAAADHATFAVEHGVHWLELGGLARFRANGFTSPVPVGDVARIKAGGDGAYRVFGLSPAMPGYTFALVVLFTIGITLLLALSAGFGLARTREATTPAQGAAWGALVGPAWAIAMLLANALVAGNLFGRAVVGSVFGSFLIGGALAGAAGGALGVRSSGATPQGPTP